MQDDEQPVRRRIAGFRLGFEKIFKTTSLGSGEIGEGEVKWS